MNDVAGADAETLAPAASPTDAASAERGAHRGRLFRKYLTLTLSLVTVALLVSGAISVYFTYQETRASLASLQYEKAVGAASRIEQYMRGIEQQLAYAALPQLDAGDIEQRRIEFLKLLRQAPEVTDVAQLDANGRERIAVSRLGMDAVDSGKDRSAEAAFRNATRAHTWFGPVYFRKETEPYMTMAVRSGGDRGPVTIADVNLKFIWDVVSRIKIGDRGKAYVVDDRGFLVADPDIGLVLRKTNLADLPHVKAALGGTASGELAMLSTDLSGARVLAAVAPIEPLDWKVFVEQPASEVYAKLNASILRTALLLLAGFVISALGAWALTRNMVRPIRTLEDGARRIGAGDLDQKIDVRTGDELEALAGQFNRMSSQLKESYAGLERKVEARTHELQNALEQQTAISEILRVISSSPTDVQPVLQAVAERAAHLCNAPFARVMVVDGGMLRPAADFSTEPVFSGNPVPLARTSVTGRAVVDRTSVHFADVAAVAQTEFPGAVDNIRRLGCRAVLAVPLLREGGAYGGIFLFRRDPGLFSPDQVALVQTFARQAAIAIDNVRLFNETKEALDQQTAISEILRVISGSPGDVKPMLSAVAERALRLCDAVQSNIFLVDGDALRFVAGFGGMTTFEEGELTQLTRERVVGRATLDHETIHIPDIVPLLDTEYPVSRMNQAGYRLKFRAILAVPLMRESRAIGAISLWRPEPKAFTDKQVALVKTFADQAAIAIENVRLFNETKEALDQQTAISEILRVISGSPGDVKPMLSAVAERALKLCDATQSTIVLVDGDNLRFAAGFGTTPTLNDGEAMSLTRGSVTGRAVIDRTVIHLEDLAAASEEAYPIGRELQRRIGHRAILAVPLMREDRAIGAIALWRMEARRFSDKQIALVKTFADQAAIAIENVRLFNETKEALEQQQASAEVLSVIGSSVADTAPVFERIARSCKRLFDGTSVSINLVGDDGLVHVGYYDGPNPDAFRSIFPAPLSSASSTGIAILERRVVHHPDVEGGVDVPEYTRRTSEATGTKSVVFAPMLWEGRGIGVIRVGRPVLGLFSDKEIALLKTFADQAVIAIQNARLFNETKEALEQQTAVAEILRVISSSPTDVQPVLDAIAERAAKLCDASAASMYLIDGNVLRHLASQGPSADPVTHVDALPISRDSLTGRAVLEQKTIQLPDLLAAAAEYPLSHEIARRFGHRTVIVTPLVREGRSFGAILLRRQEVRPFTEREAALLRTFGDQAAIALENVRLFNETKEALERQTATAEVLRAISRTTFELQPVLEMLIENATRMCKAENGHVLLRDGDVYRLDASHGAPPEFIEFMRHNPIVPDYGTAVGRAALTRQIVHIEDAKTDPTYRWAEARDKLGFRSILAVPMLRKGEPIGVVAVWRDEVRPFAARDIDLVASFADQAVIAIENVRLFNETKEALEQQRASGEVLAAISSSIADTTPVFDKIIESCQRLFAGRIVGINVVGDDGLNRLVGYHGPGREEIEQTFPAPVDESTGTGVAILRRDIVQLPDIDHGSGVPPVTRQRCQAMGIKAVAIAPMLWEGKGIGAIFVGRDYEGNFSTKDLGLLKTFADQAAIAIQNARLFNETREALDQQRASGEVLAAISNSIADTSPVFERILAGCERLFAGKVAQINLVGDDGMVRLGAYHGPGRERMERLYPFPVDRTSATGMAILDRTGLHFPDVDHDPRVPPRARTGWQAMDIKSIIGAPMMWENRGIGAIFVGRGSAGPFSEKDISLLRTFADQAVIAVQNARLFNETKEALEQQRASGEVLAAISSSIADTTPVFEKILASCERLFAGKVAGVNLVGDDGLIRLCAYHGPGREQLERVFPLAVDESGSGAAISSRSVIHYPDVLNDEGVPEKTRRACQAVGYKGVIFAPMVWEGKAIGVIFVGRDHVGPFSEKDIALLKTFADQAVIAIQNARLFREIEDKSRQLEVANKHKSEFLANMSHELRTPLNAIIGFSEVLLERLFGGLNEKQEDYMKDIHSSGKHLLTLINDILDLSKIEAGRMELEPSSFDLATALANALTLFRERAQRHGIALAQEVDTRLGDIVADERKFKQILLNLLSNAVKFTPDGGRIDVTARLEEHDAVIAVHDTGIGIAPEDRDAVFEEFRQVGHDYTKKHEGTGLGLALTRKFVELHGGRIWLDSELGKGSTFTFTIPLKP